MNTMKTILTTLALFASLGTAHAAPGQTGTEWMRDCDDKLLTMRALCSQYALGVAGGLRLWQIGDLQTARVCLPDKVTADQLVAVARKYYKDQPKDRHMVSFVFLGLAFLDAWPCPGETK